MTNQTERNDSMRRVVVTGIGAVTPIGNDVKSMWDALKAGKNGIDKITRLDLEDYKISVAAEVKDFDPLKYFEKAEARKTDRFVQYAIAASTEAMEQSGLAGNIDPDRLGVYYGSGIGGLETMTTEIIKMNEKGMRRVSPHFIPMMIANMAGGSVAIKFNAKGPNVPMITACATSTNTIGEAFRAIKHGYMDACIAGGSEAAITKVGIGGFGNMTALSTSEDPDLASLPFDSKRNGFVIGEGAGTMVLEEYEHAKARGAEILGEICGYGATCDAYHVTAPEPAGQGATKCILLAIEEAGMEGDRGVYINAHGTGTELNDIMETKAIKNAFGDTARDVLISSTKSMTGHTLGAAGAIEAIAAMLALNEGIIPPTIGLIDPDAECDLDYVPLKARHADIRWALSESFGFGGHNACVAFKKFGG